MTADTQQIFTSSILLSFEHYFTNANTLHHTYTTYATVRHHAEAKPRNLTNETDCQFTPSSMPGHAVCFCLNRLSTSFSWISAERMEERRRRRDCPLYLFQGASSATEVGSVCTCSMVEASAATSTVNSWWEDLVARLIRLRLYSPILSNADLVCQWDGWHYCYLVAECPNNMLMYLRDGSAQTAGPAATLRQKLQIKLASSPGHSALTLGWWVQVLTL